MDLVNVVNSAHWAITEDALAQVREIAAREHVVTPEALEKVRSAKLERAERASVRGSTAILYAQGPMFRKANLMTEVSGATSYESLRRDLQAALDNPAVDSIVLSVESPGGEVSGVDELARAIFESRGKKPITAHIGGMGASAAYWLASAADRIVVSDAAQVGSIGVVTIYTDTSARDEKSGVKRTEFVSSQSPGKRPDIGTGEGRARIQQTVDALADVFVAAVAEYRGVEPGTVTSRFGNGWVRIGADAVANGMADATGSLEDVISSFSNRGTGRVFNRSQGGISMSTSTSGPATAEAPPITAEAMQTAVATAREAAAREANERIAAVLNDANAASLPALANHLAFKSPLAASDCASILAAAASDIAKSRESKPVSIAQQRQDSGNIASVAGPSNPAPASQSAWGPAVKRVNASITNS